jgi:hypothetical protein
MDFFDGDNHHIGDNVFRPWEVGRSAVAVGTAPTMTETSGATALSAEEKDRDGVCAFLERRSVPFISSQVVVFLNCVSSCWLPGLTGDRFLQSHVAPETVNQAEHGLCLTYRWHSG